MNQAPGYSIAVRALCEFTAKVGDLDPVSYTHLTLPTILLV